MVYDVRTMSCNRTAIGELLVYALRLRMRKKINRNIPVLYYVRYSITYHIYPWRFYNQRFRCLSLVKNLINSHELIYWWLLSKHLHFTRCWVYVYFKCIGLVNISCVYHWPQHCMWLIACLYPADTRRWINAALTLVQRRRRWTNIKPTLIQRLVSAGYSTARINPLDIFRDIQHYCFV